MARKVLTVTSVAYLLLLLYSSLMPFDFHGGREHVRQRYRKAISAWPVGTGRLNRGDAISNVALYVPLGAMLAARVALAGRRKRRDCPLGGVDSNEARDGTDCRPNADAMMRLLGAAAGMTAAVTTSLLVETCQLFSMTRISSVQDVLFNFLGGSAGAIIGATAGPSIAQATAHGLRRRLVERPWSIVGILMMALLAADAFFPWLPTIDAGQVWRNLKLSRTYLDLPTALSSKPWHQWLVAQVALYAALAAVLGAGRPGRGVSRWLFGSAMAALFAIVLECGKPLFVHRFANLANVIMAVAGAAGGGLLCCLLGGLVSRRVAAGLAAALLASYVVCTQLDPFVFAWDPPTMLAKWPRGAAWLPMYHYAMGARAEDIRLFARTIVLVSATVFACRGAAKPAASTSRAEDGGVSSDRPAHLKNRCRIVGWSLLAGLAGASMEALQFLLPTRSPTTTDVFSFMIGGGLGAWLWAAVEARRAMATRAAMSAAMSAVDSGRLDF